MLQVGNQDAPNGVSNVPEGQAEQKEDGEENPNFGTQESHADQDFRQAESE